MTVSSETSKSGPYIGDGSNTSFDFDFTVFTKNDVNLKHTDANGVETDLTLDSHYSVNLNADQDADPGGNITYPISGTPLPSTEKLTPYRKITYTQGTDITAAGGFNPDTIEDMVDRVVMLAQQLKEARDRTLVASISDTSPPAEIPTATARASKFLGFDANGDPMASEGSGTPTSAFMATVNDDEDAAAVQVTLKAKGVVDTLTNLKAETNITNGRAIFLTDSNRGGEFVFSNADLSTEVTADTQNGIYVPPNSDATGASGAWVRRYSGALQAGWFGFSASATGATNTTALSAALSMSETLSGTIVELPAGAFTLEPASAFSVNSAGVYIVGQGAESTILNVSGSSTLFSFSNTGRGWGIKGLSVKYASPPAVATTIKGITAATSGIVEDIYIEGCKNGIELGNAQATRLSHIEIWDFYDKALNFSGGLNDVYLDSIFLNGNNNAAAVGWGIAGKAHAIMASNIEIIQCNQPAQWIGAASSINTIAFSRFFNIFFDSSISPAYYQYLYDVEFHGCWWSQREFGAVFFDSTNIKMFGGGAVNCDKHGIVFDTGCDDIELHGVTADSNSQLTSGAYSGLIFSSGVSNFRIFGGYFGNSGVVFSSTQKYGIFLGGSNNNYLIYGTEFEGNTVGAIGGHTSSSTKRVRDCIGYVTENSGTYSVNTDANGEDDIPHGLSVIPTSCWVHVVGDTPQEATIRSVDATNVRVRIRNTTSDTDLVSGAVTVVWGASVVT